MAAKANVSTRDKLDGCLSSDRADVSAGAKAAIREGNFRRPIPRGPISCGEV